MKRQSSTKAPEVAASKDVLTGERRLHGRALGAVLVALMLTLFLEALDQTVVATALPRIIGSLQGFDLYIWAVTAYTLASCTLIPIVGKLSDQFGRKGFLTGGTVLFLLGSLLCGTAQTMAQFIVYRAIQGLGAGIGIALVYTVVGDIFPPTERGKWQGVVGSVYGLASVVGPGIGGWLTDHGPLLGSLATETTRWHWIFYINLPFGLLALAGLLVYLPANISARSSHALGWNGVRRIDFLGAILASSATICLLLGLTWGSNQIYAWSDWPVVSTLVAAGVFYAGFFLVERFAVEPILPLDLFGNRIFTASALLSLLQLMVLVGLIIYLPLFLQGVANASSANAGFLLIALTLASVIGTLAAGFIVGSKKRYKLICIVAALLMAVGVFLLTRMTTNINFPLVICALIISGLGIGVFFLVPSLATQNSLPPTRLGVGTAAIRYMGQLGSVLGLAITGTVVNTTLSAQLAPRLAQLPGIRTLPAPILKLAANPQTLVNSNQRAGLVDRLVQQTPPEARPVALRTLNLVFDALKSALHVALLQGFTVVLIMCLAALLCAFLIKDAPFHQAQDTSSETTV